MFLQSPGLRSTAKMPARNRTPCPAAREGQRAGDMPTAQQGTLECTHCSTCRRPKTWTRVLNQIQLKPPCVNLSSIRTNIKEMNNTKFVLTDGSLFSADPSYEEIGCDLHAPVPLPRETPMVRDPMLLQKPELTDSRTPHYYARISGEQASATQARSSPSQKIEGWRL